jgi:RNA polymerase sigma factor (sigma-70 family)
MQSIAPGGEHEQFRQLVEAVRPELHRYCARMMGSVADGEDVVQEVLVRAYASIDDLEHVSLVRPWLFRIAHNRAMDLTRAYGRRMSDPLEAVEGRVEEHDPAIGVDARLQRAQAVNAAIHRFGELTPIQRSCVVLKDVLEHSLEETAALCRLSTAAVQAALSRGRARLARLNMLEGSEPSPGRRISPDLVRYAALFGAHDWDGVRALLADDVRLEVVARMQRNGSGEVGSYFSNYAKLEGWGVALGWLEGREVLVVHGERASPPYFIEVRFVAERVVSIRDFRHVPYVAKEARLELLEPAA